MPSKQKLNKCIYILNAYTLLAHLLKLVLSISASITENMTMAVDHHYIEMPARAEHMAHRGNIFVLITVQCY